MANSTSNTANAVAYASKYAGEFDKMIVQEAKTGFLADNAWKAKFAGANTVYVPEISTVGLGNYDRSNGYPKGKTTLTYQSYTLSQERARQLYIDAQDADESGVADLAGKMIGEYVRTEVTPEIDAYVIAALAQKAAAQSHESAYTATTAVADFLSAINNVENATEYSASELVAFVDPTCYAALMTSDELTRQIILSQFKQGEADFKVKKLNGCTLIPVSGKRMKTKFDFDAGATVTAGGFKAHEKDSSVSGDADAKSVRALILPKDAAALVKKVDNVKMFTPDEVEDLDAYKINFRLYYDLIIKKSRNDTIYTLTA